MYSDLVYGQSIYCEYIVVGVIMQLLSRLMKFGACLH